MRQIERVTAPVTRTQIVRFAGACGDFNPIHHDEPFARAAGQPSVFAMGQLTAAMLGSLLDEWLGRDRVLAFGVRYRDRVWPGDRLILRGELVDDGDLGGGGDGTGRCELEAVRHSDGVLVATGWARARV